MAEVIIGNNINEGDTIFIDLDESKEKIVAKITPHDLPAAKEPKSNSGS